MTWVEYILTVAAPHSRYSAEHWFRYLLKAAFTEGSPTREHILCLNSIVTPNKLSELRKKFGDDTLAKTIPLYALQGKQAEKQRVTLSIY